MSTAWVLVALYMVGALGGSAVLWFVTKQSERPRTFGDWVLWGALCAMWLHTAAHAAIDFFLEDYE